MPKYLITARRMETKRSVVELDIPANEAPLVHVKEALARGENVFPEWETLSSQELAFDIEPLPETAEPSEIEEDE